MKKPKRLALLSSLLFAGLALALLAFLAPPRAQADGHPPYQPENVTGWIDVTRAGPPNSATYRAVLRWSPPKNDRKAGTVADGGAVSKYQVAFKRTITTNPVNPNHEYSNLGTLTWTNVTGGANARSHTFTNSLNPSTNYLTLVRACATHSGTDVCGHLTGAIVSTPPPRPGGLTGFTVTPHDRLPGIPRGVKYELGRPTSGGRPHGYEFQWRPTGTTTWRSLSTWVSHVGGHYQRDFDADRAFDIRARAYNASGWGAWRQVSVPGRPAAPTNVGVAFSGSSATVTWTRPSGSLNGFTIQHCAGNNCKGHRLDPTVNPPVLRPCPPSNKSAYCTPKWTNHNVNNGNATSRNVGNVNPDQENRFRVRANTSARRGFFSDVWPSQTAPKKAAGVTVTVAEPVEIDEGGSGATYTVVLDGQPTGDVTITASSDNSDVTTQPASLTFTPDNWQTPQTVTLRAGDDDDAANDTATITHTVSGADGYAGIAVASVSVSVADDDEAGVTVTPTSLDVPEGGSATYTVVLDAQPIGDVLISMFASNDISAQPGSLTFTSDNWRNAQTVTVSAGQDDDTDDETAYITHGVGAGPDSGYDRVLADPVLVSIADDDEPTPQPAQQPEPEPGSVTVSATNLPIGEGDAATYTVVLDVEPTANVTITVSSDHGDVTTQPASLTFTPDNWQTAQTVTVRAGQDDDATDETGTLSHAASGGNYDGVAVASVAVSVTDDDEPAAQPAQQPEPEPGTVTVSAANLPLREGGSTTYTVALDVEPTANVTITVSSNNGDVTTQPSSLTFTTGNWQSAQTVSVSAGQDEDKADDTATLSHAASGGNYDGVTVASVAVSITDDDSDREILRAFYDAMGGSGWSNKGNWGSDKPLNQWHGVTTNGSGQVTHLSLRNNGLSGSLPAALGKLDSLQVLSLDRNSIGGSLPSELGNLSNLTRLAMNRNSLSGAIPSQLGSLSNLSIIGLARNSLSGSLPTSLGNLSGLTKVSLHDNTALSGALPSGFTNLANLQRLAIANTGLCAPDDEAFTNWLDTVPDKPGGVATCE